MGWKMYGNPRSPSRPRSLLILSSGPAIDDGYVIWDPTVEVSSNPLSTQGTLAAATLPTLPRYLGKHLELFPAGAALFSLKQCF